MQPPAFIAFTGVDSADHLPAMHALSARYPIEWGILVDPERSEDLLFPDAELRMQLLTARDLRWAAHVCGAAARAIVADPDNASVEVAGASRAQVNHGVSGSTPEQVRNVARFGRRMGVRSVLQTLGDFPTVSGVDWLFDASFGTGRQPDRWPALPGDEPFCGYSGGLGPETVAASLAQIAAPRGALYWIDMEGRIRTDGRLDIDKCASVCRAVYGER